MKNDEKIELVFSRTSEEFIDRVNAFLREGNWRISETRVSHADSDYFAVLIKSSSPKPGAPAGGSEG